MWHNLACHGTLVRQLVCAKFWAKSGENSSAFVFHMYGESLFSEIVLVLKGVSVRGVLDTAHEEQGDRVMVHFLNNFSWLLSIDIYGSSNSSWQGKQINPNIFKGTSL